MPATAPQLAYQPKPKWHGPPPYQLRWLVAAIVAIAAVAATSWYGPRLWHNAKTVTLQRRCLDYRPPPSPRVVYVDEPSVAAATLKQPNYYPDFSGGRRAVYHNPLWSAFAGAAAPPVFMHRRTSPAGKERLVVVQVSAVGGGGDPYHRIVFVPYVEGIATLKGRRHLAATSPGMEMYRNTGDWTMIVEGVADPADPSHFTIDYSLNNTPSTIDGWLNDDDTVTLSPRAGVTADAGARHILWSPAGAPLPGWVHGRAPLLDATTQPIRPKQSAGGYRGAAPEAAR